MRFPDSFLDEIRERLPVSEVVRQRVQLKKAGREWRGLSPFNKEKTPSFFVNDQKGFYHDFSSGKSGDQFKFLMETEGLTFPEAVERLAQMAGLQVPKQSREAEREEQKRKSLFEVMELATTFFETQFANAIGESARAYAIQRGLTKETLKEFRIGYAPSGRFALKEYLGAAGVPVEDMIATGLLIAGDDIPVPYDRFRDRLIIPIHDQRGRIIAFGGRALSVDAQAKYLNSPETPLFHKGATIFNFHRARQPAHDDGSVVVVEGYMDAIAVYQAGVKSVVASMGTALTEEQIGLLWRLSPEPIVCFDSDKAGVAAAHRSIDRILPELKIGRTFQFAFLRGGKDPDDLVKEKNGIEMFKSMLGSALPLWDVLWAREVENSNIRTPDARARLENRLYEIVRTIKDPVVNAQYKGTCRLELSDLFWRTIKGKKKSEPKAFVPKLAGRNEVQKTLLGLLVHYPENLEAKEALIDNVKFQDDLQRFQLGLYELLVVSKDVSVDIIYERLSPSFYDVLEEVHGHAKEGLPRGHRLMWRLPLVKFDPPADFVSECIDYFVMKLIIGQLEVELEEAIVGDEPLASEESGERFTELVRELQKLRESALTKDLELAEEAASIRRVWGEAPWQTAA